MTFDDMRVLLEPGHALIYKNNELLGGCTYDGPLDNALMSSADKSRITQLILKLVFHQPL